MTDRAVVVIDEGLWHVGRSWVDHPLEDRCHCKKGPCGLAVLGSNPDCPEHAPSAAKTIRQGHLAIECPERKP